MFVNEVNAVETKDFSEKCKYTSEQWHVLTLRSQIFRTSQGTTTRYVRLPQRILHCESRLKETIKFWQKCAIVQHTERGMKAALARLSGHVRALFGGE